MRTGTISEIIDYYRQSSVHKHEIERAVIEFFDVDSMDVAIDEHPGFLNVDAPAHRLFFE